MVSIISVFYIYDQKIIINKEKKQQQNNVLECAFADNFALYHIMSLTTLNQTLKQYKIKLKSNQENY